jgi:hypothetical protein
MRRSSTWRHGSYRSGGSWASIVHLVIFLANMELSFCFAVGLNLLLASSRLNKPLLEVARGDRCSWCVRRRVGDRTGHRCRPPALAVCVEEDERDASATAAQPRGLRLRVGNSQQRQKPANKRLRPRVRSAISGVRRPDDRSRGRTGALLMGLSLNGGRRSVGAGCTATLPAKGVTCAEANEPALEFSASPPRAEQRPRYSTGRCPLGVWHREEEGAV